MSLSSSLSSSGTSQVSRPDDTSYTLCPSPTIIRSITYTELEQLMNKYAQQNTIYSGAPSSSMSIISTDTDDFNNTLITVLFIIVIVFVLFFLYSIYMLNKKKK